MTGFFSFLYVLFMQYIIPFVYAVGFVILIHGIINYYFIGPTDEGRRQAGRISLLRACSTFGLGLLLYAVVALFSWLGSLDFTVQAPSGSGSTEVDAGVRTDTSKGLLNVPNVPNENSPQ